jgi:competence protein ComEC
MDPRSPRGIWRLARFPALVVAAAWSAAVAAAVVLVPSQPILGAIATTLAIPCLGLALLIRPAVLAIALAFALMAVGRSELPPPDPQAAVRALAVAGQSAIITGRVADDSHPTGGGAEALVEPDRISIAGVLASGLGNLLVRWRGPQEAAYGDRVEASGKLTLPRDLPTFDRRAYLAQRHVFLEVIASSFDVVSTGAGLAGIPGWLRRHYVAAVDAALPAPHASVLLGIVLGVRQGIPTNLDNALIATGLIHLLVLSGLKVAIFGRIVQGALQPLLGRHATWPVLALIGLYALAGGATPAAVRAAIMGGLALVASRLGRPSHVWTSLALTGGAMLAWHPELAWDVGFQLSFAGTAAIILLTPGIERRLPRMPAVLREPFAVTCAAQIGTLPMMATDFHTVSLIGPIANAAVLPLLPALVAAGLALGPLALVLDLVHMAALSTR